MDTLIPFRTAEEFDLFLKTQGHALAQDAAKYLKSALMSPASPTIGKSELLKNPSRDTEGYIASILFMGPVFGEFILSVEKEAADKLFSSLLEGTEGESRVHLICEAMAEILNQAAGKRMHEFNQTFKRMTMATPKVTQGKIMFRGIRSAKTDIETEFGKISVSLYVDQMKTDLADAHREMIAQLKTANYDLEKVNQQIKEQQIQLVQSEKMASLGLMAAGVAHEINNPLSFVMANIDTLSTYIEVTTRLISGYSNFLKHLVRNDKQDAAQEIDRLRTLEEQEEINYVTEDSQKLIEESREGLERIRRIVSGLKRFSRQENSDVRPAQLNDEIMNTLELLRNELKYKCRIETNLKPIREIRCLASELSQVFVNILVNASQAMPETGGTIRIETFEENDFLVIRFSDTGVGMTPEVLNKLFQPFFTTKPVGKGTGLGLAISFGIIERHGGKIEVHSKPGEGSTFTIRLPYERTAQSA